MRQSDAYTSVTLFYLLPRSTHFMWTAAAASLFVVHIQLNHSTSNWLHQLQVYIIGAAADEQKAEGRAAKHDSYALDKISIRVSPKVFGARIRCLPDDSALASALEDIVAGRVAGGYEGNKPGGAHDDDE